MASTGFTICGTGANITGVGTQAWASPGNITADDSADANGDAADKSEQMNWLVGSNFGFAIPGGSTIDGIEARLQAYDTAGTNGLSDITHVVIYKDNSTPGNDLEAGTTNVSLTPTNYDYGDSAELWGLSWTPAEINSSNFQLRISMNSNEAGSVAGNPRVDFLAVNVHYTEAAPTDTDAVVSGSALVEASGSSLYDAASNSFGAASAESVGAATSDANADSSGTALAEAEGATTEFREGAGLSGALSVAEATGAMSADADADSSSISIPEAVGAVFFDAASDSTGSALAEAVGLTVFNVNADSSGTALAEADGAAQQDAAASSNGMASALAESEGGAVVSGHGHVAQGGSGVRGEASAIRRPDKTRVRQRQPRQIEVIKVGKWPDEPKPQRERPERVDYSKAINQTDPDEAEADEEEAALIAILAFAA